MPARTPYLGQPSGSGDQVGSLKAFAANPGAKWAVADGALIKDTGAQYPALARALGVGWFSDEVAVGTTPPWPPGVDPKVNPADGSVNVCGNNLRTHRTTDGGDTWAQLAYAAAWPADGTAGYGGVIAHGHAFGNGIHVYFHVRQSAGEYEDPPGSGEVYQWDDRRYFIHRTANAGVSWQVSPAWNAVYEWRETSFPNQPASIDFSPTLGLFVMGTYGGKIFTSADGLTWTQRHQTTFLLTLHQSVRWIAKVGRFYVTGNGGVNFRHSADGINWTVAALPAGGAALPPREFPGGVFMTAAPGGAAAPVYKSADGVTWSAFAMPATLQALDPALGLTGALPAPSVWGEGGGVSALFDYGSGRSPRYVFYSTTDFVTWARGSTLATTLVSATLTIGNYCFHEWYGSFRYVLRTGIRKPKCDPIGGRTVYVKLKD